MTTLLHVPERPGKPAINVDFDEQSPIANQLLFLYHHSNWQAHQNLLREGDQLAILAEKSIPELDQPLVAISMLAAVSALTLGSDVPNEEISRRFFEVVDALMPSALTESAANIPNFPQVLAKIKMYLP